VSVYTQTAKKGGRKCLGGKGSSRQQKSPKPQGRKDEEIAGKRNGGVCVLERDKREGNNTLAAYGLRSPVKDINESDIYGKPSRSLPETPHFGSFWFFL